MNEMEFVYEQIKNANYNVLPDTIAVGKVYKIASFGSLDKEGYEVGYLYLPKGSGIKSHIHIDDIERYKLIIGELSVKGEKTDFNICSLNDTHNIDLVKENTIIQTCKVNKLYLDVLTDLSNESFDKIVCLKENKHKKI